MIVYGIGLPRSGGQSLKAVLIELLGGCIHGPSTNVKAFDHPCVEVFRHPDQLRIKHPACKFIFNVRWDADSWLRSCAKVYPVSTKWQNPIWKYPLCDFLDYRKRYIEERLRIDDCLVWDLTADPTWDKVCEFLGKPVPQRPFPNLDSVCGRSGIVLAQRMPAGI